MRFSTLICASLVLCFSGCSSGTDPEIAKRPKVYPVTGSVTLAGQPVEKAVVIFVGGDGVTARGVTDASGEFALTTFDQNDGAVAGAQQVGILKEEAGYDPNQLKIGEAPPAVKADRNALPKKYADPKSSGLKADVKDGQENHFTFDLTDKP
tara:strand:- start:92352 stop:92807 length:456 start_codon:yes stop_codon:yes gene_type:complete